MQIMTLTQWHNNDRKSEINTRTCVKKFKKNWQSGNILLLDLLHTMYTLPLTVSCCSKIQIDFTYLVPGPSCIYSCM